MPVPDERVPTPIRLTDIELLAVKLAAMPALRCTRLTKPVYCCLCNALIRPGEMYRNGGLNSRAHFVCVAQTAAPVQTSGEAGTG